jgi:2-amino-4-hydroxy-6-hydroxymethyldihydropteridine diphosphokinase
MNWFDQRYVNWEMTVDVLIALGSNLAPEEKMPAALAALEKIGGLRIFATSPFYRTAPLDRRGQISEQPAFLNAAVRAETTLTPDALRKALREVEAALGRVRTADKFAPRPIDLDLAMVGGTATELAGKPLPDPDIGRFAHLAIPLADVAPDWELPDGRTLAEVAALFAPLERLALPTAGA